MNGQLVEELDGAGNVKARNIWGNDIVYRQDVASAQAGYYVFNAHGDVAEIVSAAG